MAETAPKQIIDEVMSGREFTKNTVNTDGLKRIIDKVLDFFNKIIEKISEIIEKILEKLGLGEINFTQEKYSRVVIGILCVVLFAVLVLLTVKIIRLISRKIGENRLKESFEEELEAYAGNPSEPYEISRRYYGEGDFRMSFRYLFIAMLVNFNEKEIITIHRAKTNRTYLAEIMMSDVRDGEFAEPFFDAFDLYWYGEKPVDRETMDGWYGSFDSFFAGEGAAEKS